MTDSMHALATSYVANGWPVFPTRAAPEESVDQRTGEVITLKAKTPNTPRGLKDATTVPHIVDAWWGRKYPGAMVGIPTGTSIGAWVLDVDPKSGGYETLADLEADNDILPDTRTARTPSGGRHYYFAHHEGVRNRGAMGAGLDVRGTGGYVVAPGSVMADGRAYMWDNDNDILPAPDWLLEMVIKKEPVASAVSHTAIRSEIPESYFAAAVDGELSDLVATPMGGRNNALNDSAFRIGTLVASGGLTEGQARDLLQAVAREWGRDWAQCCKTIENGLRAGMRHPREIPEREDWGDGDNTRLVDVKRMIATGLAKAGTKPSTTEWGVKATKTTAEETPTTTTHNEPAVVEVNDKAEKGPISATPFTWIDPRTIPRRQFAFGTHYIRKYVSVTVSPGGIGKTSNSIAEALAMASGKPLNGTKPPQRLKVWLFNAEDPRDELERRFMAACLHFKLKPQDIDGYLFLDSGREQEMVVAVDDKRTGVKIMVPVVEAVVAEITRNRIDVMIVDPFVSTHSVNENDNGAIDKVAKLWAQIADQTNCSIDIVHHLRKVADREATVEDARGAVSLIGAARSVRVFNVMSADQARDGMIPQSERFSYFSMSHGKSNLTPRTAKLDWRHLIGVPLGNGAGISRPQDHAPVVTAWEMPDAQQMIEGVTKQQIRALLGRIGGETCTYNYQATNWAGHIVADVLGITLEAGLKKTPDHARIERMINAWIDDGTLRKEVAREVTGKQAGRDITYVRVGK